MTRINELRGTFEQTGGFRTLQDLREHRAEHAVSTAEREFFAAPIDEHENEVRRSCRDMRRLEDC